MADSALSAEHFARVDETDDALFYEMPRLVKHIDEPACAALAAWFRNNLPAGGDILDLMSSCVSHLPTDVAFRRVCGLGMNEDELAANPQLTDHLIHDLTRDPTLPFADGEFDVCLISVSVQYLIHPLEVFAEIARVLRPGAICAVSFSNRMFPTKAIALWRAMGDKDHARLVGYYFIQSGGFEAPEFTDLSPDTRRSDPLFLVTARSKGRV
jgi:SAM-dependent methyltransferase